MLRRVIPPGGDPAGH